MCCKKIHFRGYVFVFRNRKATALKALIVYDGQGFWLLSQTAFQRKIRLGGLPSKNAASAKTLAAHQLQVLLCSGQSRTACRRLTRLAAGGTDRLMQSHSASLN